ncbi:MAG: 6,7-dimethyl-8-ribityllumazine synthase [Gemmatimonadota bacterium]
MKTSTDEFHPELNASGKRFALLVSRFNAEITERLLEGARGCLLRHGADEAKIEVVRVPGAWELPQVAARLVGFGRFDAVVALGCVIRGETSHYDFVAGEASSGLGAVARQSPVPVLFGVLTTDTVAQADARSGEGGGNKGWETALAALELVALYGRLR